MVATAERLFSSLTFVAGMSKMSTYAVHIPDEVKEVMDDLLDFMEFDCPFIEEVVSAAFAGWAAARTNPCWGCSAIPGQGERFLHCSPCKEMGTRSYFCSQHCYASSWKRHKRWHCKLREDMQEHRAEELQSAASSRLALWRFSASTCDNPIQDSVEEYGLLVKYAAGILSTQPGRAARHLRKAIAMDCHNPRAYGVLGSALLTMGNVRGGFRLQMEALQRFNPLTEAWVMSAACAMHHYRLPECAEEPCPPWWNDEALKALTACMVDLMPNYFRLHELRAFVLAGGGFELTGFTAPPFDATPRTTEELRAAGASYQRAAQLDIDNDKEYYADCANCCVRAARLAKSGGPIIVTRVLPRCLLSFSQTVAWQAKLEEEGTHFSEWLEGTLIITERTASQPVKHCAKNKKRNDRRKGKRK